MRDSQYPSYMKTSRWQDKFYLNIQQTGGTYKTADAFILQRFLAEAASEKECLSIFWVNRRPAMRKRLGQHCQQRRWHCLDKLIEQGGRVILTETTELIGTLIFSNPAPKTKSWWRIWSASLQRYKLVNAVWATKPILHRLEIYWRHDHDSEKAWLVIKGGHTTINQVVDNGTIPMKRADCYGRHGIWHRIHHSRGTGRLIYFIHHRPRQPFGFPTVPVMKSPRPHSFMNVWKMIWISMPAKL